MKTPAPRSMLAEHPALPLTFGADESRIRTIGIKTLGIADRRCIAAQLVALCALLADFELWPGRAGLLRAKAEETGEGFRARLDVIPVSLSRVWSGLGGGDPAAEATRNAVLGAVTTLTGIDLVGLGESRAEPGFFLDGVLSALLGEIDRPLNGATARSLWMWKWSLPELVPPGDTKFLAIPDEAVARRVGAAMWASAVRQGRGATFELAAGDGKRLAVVKQPGVDTVNIVAGTLDEGTLTALLERRDTGSTSLVALGCFSEGWNPGSEGVYARDRLSAHLALVGIAPAKRVRLIDGLTDRFDPFSAADRDWLTLSASMLFEQRRSTGKGRIAELVRVASLAPEGIPVDRALGLAGVDREDLGEAYRQRKVVLRDGLILPREPAALKVDPRHAEIAPLFDAEDPVRALHEALATANPGPILSWARTRLDDLDGGSVRRLLSPLAPGSLGAGVQAVLAEACLSLADIHGARRALRGLAEDLAQPWTGWLRTLDRRPGQEIKPPRTIDLRHAPRACAEVALVSLRRSLGTSQPAAEEALNVITGSLEHLHGANRRWVEIRLEARVRPERLDDRRWRRRMTGEHPLLAGLLLFERSSRAFFRGEFVRARRMLRRAMAAEGAPGRLALMQLNLGQVEAEAGRQQASEALTLGAYRLFQMAGFRHRASEALYSLAVSDIDQLRVERAGARLDALADMEGSIHLEVERVRLELARGRLEEFRRGLIDLPKTGENGDSQIDKAVSFLQGVEALFFGSRVTARKLLGDGGEEGETWLDFVYAVTEDGPRPSAVAGGGWGLRRAAALARRLQRMVEEIAFDGNPDLEDAMAISLCCQLGLRPGWPPRELRRCAVEVLARQGLDGWASRLRWGNGEVDLLLRGLSGLIRGGKGDSELASNLEAALASVGIGGLVVRTAQGGRELLRVGEGDAFEGHVRGEVEVLPLGVDPIPGPAWELLVDLLELMYSGARDEEAEGETPEVRIDGVSAAAVSLRAAIIEAAAPRFTILVHGETGTGKEIVAREIHRLSKRSGDLVSVNVAAIPANLLEAELFGSVKGAFTGADRSRRGLVAAAEGGTLFLDEVGDLDVALQVKLLRFLESGEIRPVGADRTGQVDVRVICATHRNLERRVRERRFREDLYYRMAMARIDVPALRERSEDIPILRAIFAREAARRHRLQMTPWTASAIEVLMNHAWPGNIRELKHTVEVAMARAGGCRIRPEHLPIAGGGPVVRGTWEQSLATFKKRLLAEVLTRHHGNRSAAARDLGISRQALLYQIKKLRLNEL